MGKKKPEEMAKQRKIFCKGAKATSQVSEELANHIFDLMEKFAGYGFNKSHSASYALIAYQTAWLKTHYPSAFMAAVLSSEMDRTEKIITLLAECQTLKVHVSPPDINRSDYHFTVVDEKHLLYGLGAIKGVGEAAIENIIKARDAGPFADLFDFCYRVDLRKVNKRALEALIKSGSFDIFSTHRASLMASLNQALQQAEQVLHNQTYGQHDLLDLDAPRKKPSLVEVENWSEQLQLQGEKETLGFYLSGHPLNRYLKEFTHFTTCPLSDLHPSDHPNATVAGMITHIRTRQTKRGDRIAILTFDDGTSTIEAICFSDAYQKYRGLLHEDQLLIIEGEVSLDNFNQKPRLVCREIQTLDDIRQRLAKQVHITLSKTSSLDLDAFKETLTKHSGGQCSVVVRYIQDNILASVTLGKKWLVKPTEALLSWLEQEFAGQVEIFYK